MKHRTKRVITLTIFLIILASLLTEGCLGQNSGLSRENEKEMKGQANTSGTSPVSRLVTEEVNLSSSKAGISTIAGNYRLEALDVELKVPSYELPLQKERISNYGNFSSKIPLNESALKMLENNGFVVIENPYNPGEEDITSMYSILEEQEVPVFITTDSLLHLYHIQFDETLRQIEEKEFYDTLWKTDLALLNASIKKYNNASGEEKEAARRNTAYFAVVLSLLQPKTRTDTGSRRPLWFCEQIPFPCGCKETISVRGSCICKKRG